MHETHHTPIALPMFPKQWDHTIPSNSSKRKRAATTEPSPPESTVSPSECPGCSEGHHTADQTEPVSIEMEQTILHCIRNHKPPDVLPGEIDLDHVLSSASYKTLLESPICRNEVAGANVPIISRLYEESMMREPFHDEPKCASGHMCECMFINKHMPFVGVAFTHPHATPGSTPTFCVLCHRKITQKFFYDILLTGSNPNTLVQKHGNVFNVPGEYARECMLIPPPGFPMQCMPVPIMSHQRNK